MLEVLIKFLRLFIVAVLVVNCSGGDGDDDLKGYIQEESIVPDYDNDPIYIQANPKNLPTYWDIFVQFVRNSQDPHDKKLLINAGNN